MASGFLDVASTLTPGSSCQTGDNWGDGILINTPKNISLPTGMVQWSHLELILEDNGVASGTTHATKIFLSWDEDGDEICAGPSTKATMVAGRGDTDRYMCVYELAHHCPTIPSTATAGTVYLWIQTDAFTNSDDRPEVIRARLHWHDLTKG
tara:strand:- start:657 stop:1112 length:456 start_codon:yes stop_codon:yes gene_type:complete